MHDVTHDAQGAKLSEQGGDEAKTTRVDNKTKRKLTWSLETRLFLCEYKIQY